MTTVGIVVLNYNGWRDTIDCVTSLLPLLDEARVHLVIVDNASSDDSVARLTEWGETLSVPFSVTDESSTSSRAGELVLVRSSRNGGYAAGNNIGLRALVRDGVEFCWVLNNDTVVEAGSLRALVECAAASPTAGIIGCTIAEFDERSVVQCAGGAYYRALLTLNDVALRGTKMQETGTVRLPRINYICGAAMFIRSKLLAEIGLLNEDYFLYYEEIDFSNRAVEAGYTLEWCRSAVIYHKGGAATGGNPKHGAKSALSEYHSTLSCLKYTRTHRPLSLPIAGAARLFLKAGQHVARRHWHLLPPLLNAYYDFVTGDRAHDGRTRRR